MGAVTRVQRWLASVAERTLGPTEAKAQQLDVIQRAVVAGVIIAVLPIQQMQIPGWPAVMGACVVALIYNTYFAWLVYTKKRYFVVRTTGLVFDSVLLMGAVGSTSSIWLVFMVYIVSGGFTLAPLGSLFYTALWTSWFAFATLINFAPGTLYYQELPVRLVFLVLMGVVSLAMANELQKKRTRIEVQHRQTMGMLATLVEARDTDAGAHLHSIQEFSRALAKRLGFSDKDAEEIAYASMMHDVGKANIPDAVLKKPGELTPEDWQVMRSHTVWGDQLLSEHGDFELARVVARSHHEHWDGSGYPDGLSGTDIPLAARIVAVADVYDALISERPYKEAWTELEAIREIERLAGSHLDPQIARVFVTLWYDGTIKRVDRRRGSLDRRAAAA